MELGGGSRAVLGLTAVSSESRIPNLEIRMDVWVAIFSVSDFEIPYSDLSLAGFHLYSWELTFLRKAAIR
jgi:hypothetical protein